MKEPEILKEKQYYLKISGSAMNVPGKTPDEAIEYIRNHMHCYCFVQALEIGKDVDEQGWPINN